ncbi:MAG: hypothetical protein V2I56_20045 [Desulfobacteraceae bacterium]|jgi:hypothetical protein|nr:hypothetical protein [Desulfobacteraceae bacterium]
MKNIKHPVRNTILYGLFCGLAFVPLSLALNAFMVRPSAVCLTLWLFLAGYAILLSHWCKKTFISSVFPLLLLVPAIFFSGSMFLFFILALMAISWIRSGICYPRPGFMGLAVELLLCFIGAALAQVFTPGSVSAWALGVWMFFLVQALFFVFFEPTANRREEHERMDAFERASRQADSILTGLYSHH